MLHRDLEHGYLVISQPAHAWVSGQIAAAWGNRLTGDLSPRNEVCLAAEQHDIGWLEWESHPTLNPVTGRPRTFRELPTLEHLSVWAPAGPTALVYGPYVALLVSKHGTGLYRFHDFNRDTPDEAEAARAFMARGAAFEEQLLQIIIRDSGNAAEDVRAAIERNRKLVALWDAMSLAICGGAEGARSFDDVPAAGNSISLQLRQVDSASDHFHVGPWPFRSETVSLTYPGRMLKGTFTSEAAMRQALEDAPWQTVRVELTSAP
jgi:hypothetical protein